MMDQIAIMDLEQAEQGRAEEGREGNRRMSFIEYAPPAPRPAPPAKYKLWLMVLVSVYFADWITTEAQFLKWLRETFELSFNGALAVVLGSTVGILLFAEIDLLIAFVNIKIGGEWYGLASWLKQPRIRWVHEYNNFFAVLLGMIILIFEEGFALFNAPQSQAPKQPELFHDETVEEGDVLLKVESKVKPEKEDAYKEWRRKLGKEVCADRPGMKDVHTEVKLDPKGNTYSTCITFTSIDTLNQYMTSPVRARFMRNLQPLLVTPSLQRLRKDRNLPDAFTDLCTHQGQPVPVRLPKKWKVWFLTTLGLWLGVLITNATLTDHYFSTWGLTEANERARAAARVTVNTWLNTYVMTPFMILLFGGWLKREDKDNDRREPWRSLNDGLGSNMAKVGLLVAFYGTCGLAWALRALD